MYKNKKVGFGLLLIGILLTSLSGLNDFEFNVLLIVAGFIRLFSAIIRFWSSIPYKHYFEINDWTENRGKGFVQKVPFIKHQKHHPAVVLYVKTGEIYEKVGVHNNYTNEKDVEIISTKKFRGKVIIK